MRRTMHITFNNTRVHELGLEEIKVLEVLEEMDALNYEDYTMEHQDRILEELKFLTDKLGVQSKKNLADKFNFNMGDKDTLAEYYNLDDEVLENFNLIVETVSLKNCDCFYKNILKRKDVLKTIIETETDPGEIKTNYDVVKDIVKFN
ncbi:hypothetical protein EDC18_102390 [Natranaerovirga pectinivora]|uniref:Uncharacterized protein n=1 Tax=Natranaerovirga pectinivora TaxID=682400 RepID=A0A4R3MQ08_9FIRM|nr:hypothetical protein [Natranaerovirga pectinivora]TCT16371.1 hypothetical protein EDC18_102390 [Natranaerovirga pectinivora]